MLLRTVFVIISGPPIEEGNARLKTISFRAFLAKKLENIFEFKKWLNG